jgi:hypothetical protein
VHLLAFGTIGGWEWLWVGLFAGFWIIALAVGLCLEPYEWYRKEHEHNDEHEPNGEGGDEGGPV